MAIKEVEAGANEDKSPQPPFFKGVAFSKGGFQVYAHY